MTATKSVEMTTTTYQRSNGVILVTETADGWGLYAKGDHGVFEAEVKRCTCQERRKPCACRRERTDTTTRHRLDYCHDWHAERVERLAEDIAKTYGRATRKPVTKRRTVTVRATGAYAPMRLHSVDIDGHHRGVYVHTGTPWDWTYEIVKADPYHYHLSHDPVQTRRPYEWAVRDLARTLYRAALLAGELAYTAEDVKRELAGRDLICACSLDMPCPADVLLEIANEGEHA